MVLSIPVSVDFASSERVTARDVAVLVFLLVDEADGELFASVGIPAEVVLPLGLALVDTRESRGVPVETRRAALAPVRLSDVIRSGLVDAANVDLGQLADVGVFRLQGVGVPEEVAGGRGQ